MNEKRSAATASPVSPIALVQCGRNGAALAHIVNWLGEAFADPPPEKWTTAFAAALTDEGRAFHKHLAKSDTNV